MSMTPVHISNERGVVRRPAAVLTGAYVGFTAEKMNRKNQFVFFIDYTPAALTGLKTKVEYSIDNINWFQETFDDEQNPSGGVTTTTQTTAGKLRERNYAFTVATKFFVLVPAFAPYVRLSSFGVGTATGSSLQITEIVGVA